MMTNALSDKERALMDAYWRAANYLSVGQIYLYDNPLLKQSLTKDHIKPRLLGHWGTTPGLNFIYVHLNRAIKKYDVDMIYIIGPGHGGPGNAVSHAYGGAFDNPDLIVTCVVGDGEAETGPLATSWHSNKFLNPATDGAVLPILHLNGYKIANPEVVRVYLPPDANCLLSVTDHCLRSRNYVNVVIAGKQPAPQWLSMDEAIKHCEAGLGIWEWASSDLGGEPDVVMACCGDVPTLETLAAVDLLRH